MPSLQNAALQNSGVTEHFYLFEMANVYLPRKNDLPQEKMLIAGIFSNYSFRNAKGIVESLMDELNIAVEFKTDDANKFLPSQRLVILFQGKVLGEFGTSIDHDFKYFQFDVETLRSIYKPNPSFTPIPKYPAQIEDITLNLPERTRVFEVIESINISSHLVKSVELVDIFKSAYTFRIWYQHPDKTLTDQEVEQIRKDFLQTIKKRFGGFLR